MSPGSNTESYPAFAHIGLRENPGKNLNQATCPDRESNPGHLVSRLDALTVTPQVWDEVTGEWGKLHNIELHALYSSPDIIRNIKSRRLRWAGHVARMGESRNSYRVLVGRPEGKRPLGRPRRRWEDNIKMDLREVGYDDREWINLAQDRDQWRAYVRAAMNLRSQQNTQVYHHHHQYHTIRENTGILLEASKVIGLEVNPEKTKYMIISRDQNIVRNGNVKIGNLSFEKVEKFKDLGATVTNEESTARMMDVQRRARLGKTSDKTQPGNQPKRGSNPRNFRPEGKRLNRLSHAGDRINFVRNRDRWRAYVRAAMNLRVP
ncbi:hypothetical protein ANN_02056 [Periplaneta americana]|uniref:Uncharacterized protein n=1 Tax=Periplaneta americana TaxID=6978 RepID=A0ABQ8TVB6_PERAM|nr:hypothetical protein ANN_02056 [Periplaneta americana]